MTHKPHWSHWSQESEGAGTAVPLTIPGLKLWLDASDPTTYTLSGSSCSSWRDKSTSAYDYVQATGSRQPTWVDNVINGKPVFRFDGGDNLVASTTPLISPTTPMTLLMVTRLTSRTGFPTAINFSTPVAGQNPQMASAAGIGSYFIGAGSGNFQPGMAGNAIVMPSTNYYAIEINFSGAGSGIGNYASYVSGASVAITAIGGGVIGSGNNQNQVGGVTLADTNGWTGDHSEILLYDHVITAGERTTLATYITGKFAL